MSSPPESSPPESSNDTVTKSDSTARREKRKQKREQKKEQKKAQKESQKDIEPLICDACNIRYKSQQSYEQHLKTKTHIVKAKMKTGSKVKVREMEVTKESPGTKVEPEEHMTVEPHKPDMNSPKEDNRFNLLTEIDDDDKDD